MFNENKMIPFKYTIRNISQQISTKYCEENVKNLVEMYILYSTEVLGCTVDFPNIR